MAGSVIFEEQVEIPLDLHGLSDFRRWALSDDFPQRGRIDYINGTIEVDMSPEDLFTHGTLKAELIGVISRRVKDDKRGHLFSDRTRVSCPSANLSAEPDIVLVSHDSIDNGTVKLVPKAPMEEGRFVELEGPPDLVVEIVSNSSVVKDTRRLPQAYLQAGVREFWLADARGDVLVFQIQHTGQSGFEAVEPDADGYQRSSVLEKRYRLNRQRDAHGLWSFDLLEQ